MLKFLDGLRGITLGTTLLKMTLALLFGGIVGFERSYKNRPAGFRTHILVTLGATVASMVGIYFYLNANLPVDISRLGAAVVSGLGFLGAGTIIVTKNYTVKGLTTAAGLWATGIIGLAIGAGFYEGAVIVTVLIVVAETALSGLVTRIKRDPELCIAVEFIEKTALDQVLRRCKNNRMVILNLQVVSAVRSGENCYRAFVTIRPRLKVNREKLFGDLTGIDGVLSLKEVDQSDDGGDND
ncbi:MAG: MgtC/SapB family protein [Clostridia bacterium]|nr:MgtC/SapB family protein [Clostridia bacterium]